MENNTDSSASVVGRYRGVVMQDDFEEIRGEALVGLATRGGQRVVDLLLNEWENFDDVGTLSLEAAEETASPRLHSKLLSFKIP